MYLVFCIANYVLGAWLVLMLVMLAVCGGMSDVSLAVVAFWPGWTPWGAAARAVQWLRQYDSGGDLDRFVDSRYRNEGRDRRANR